jgi:hypothetical protein
MEDQEFDRWHRWSDRNKLRELQHPGVYVLAVSTDDLHGRNFRWLPQITYVGMTNSLAGLNGRLKQFDNTILGRTGHGGAQRFRHKHPVYSRLCDQLFVTVARFPCNVRAASSTDLRVMGKVAAFEYECLAKFVDLYARLPEFNDKQRSPKNPKSVRPKRKRVARAS